MLALGIGTATACAATALGITGAIYHAVPTSLEASAFNSGTGYTANAAAASTQNISDRDVVLLGDTFGIKLFTNGVIVAALSEVYTEDGMLCPAADAGLRSGDYIVEVDGRAVNHNSDVAEIIGKSRGENITVKVRRNDKIFDAEVTPVFSEGSFKTGMWIRDSAAGIGTLTFYDPESGKFAGLGHGICDVDTNDIMQLKTGQPIPVTLLGIDKGLPDAPGQLKGYFSCDEPLGELLANNETGVYGTLNEPPQGSTIKIMPKNEITCGAVQVLVTADENGPKLYDAEIEQISREERLTKNMVVRITDPELIALTGGIVQGMSGSPILQNGKLVGAVTHVFKEDPTCGYGIFAENMLAEMG